MIAANEGFFSLCLLLLWLYVGLKDTPWWRRNVRGERDE